MMKKISRNDACWCGSEKKYKACHLEQDRQTEEKLTQLRRQGYPTPPRSIIKSPEDIEGMRKSCKLTRDILDFLKDQIKEGITTEDINTLVHEETIKNGAYPAPLNYRGFPKSVCTSLNEIICHGIPTPERKLKNGDIINVDVTCILDGYYGDANRMYLVGEVSDEAKKLVKVTRECLELGIEAVKPFRPINVIGDAIQTHAKKHGYSVVRDFGGHGIGLEFHEEPFVFHFSRKEKGMIMVPNMTFTIEPMINIGHFGCKILKDGWTAITRDGSLSAQWEHTIRVTEDGAEIMTQ